MPTYRYLAADLLSGRVIAELPLDVSSFSRIINGAGSLSATLPFADLGGKDWRSATIPRRTALYVERDERVIVWGGIIWKRRPVTDKDGTRKVGLDAETFESYYTRRRIPLDLGYVNVDAFAIIRDMLTYLNLQPGGDIRVDADPAILSGQTHTVTYLAGERRKPLDEWQKLAAVSPGCEFTIDVGRDATGLFTHSLKLAAPRFAEGIAPIACEYPGNVADYDYPEDESGVPNSLTGIGAGEGSSMLAVSYTDFDSLAAGYPLLEDDLSAKDETDYDRLAARTLEKLRALSGDATVPTVVLRGDAEPVFGAYPLGVQARLRATSLYHPATADGGPGLDVTRRVVGWTVAPQQAGRQERVTLALGRVD